MTTGQVRQSYLDFFRSSPRNHVVIPPAPLVLPNDPTTLFTSSGMQPLVSYLLGQPHPEGQRLVDAQPCFRAQDIEAVGDNRHTTFFEMLGNWSLGDYFKAEQLAWFWEWLTQKLGLPKARLAVTVFEGNEAVPRDEESAQIWKNLGVPKERIFYYGVERNWWSRSGVPAAMPKGEPGGPDSEVFFEFVSLPHQAKFGKDCHPNCDCGRFLEIGNSVFMQYQKQADGSVKELAQKNVDFGGGLERLTAATNDEPDIFRTDVFAPLQAAVGGNFDTSEAGQRGLRIVLDHLRAATAMIEAGVIPGNKEQGYVLRRLIRRSALYAKLAGVNLDQQQVGEVIIEEIGKFEKTLAAGMKQIMAKPALSGQEVFDIYQTYGYPAELTQEYAKKLGIRVDLAGFETAKKQHQQKSRSLGVGKFKGGLADQSEAVTKLHTATHLLHAALRQILGTHVRQEGSNITAQRLRFDFSHGREITPAQIKAVEKLINDRIKQNLPVRQTFEDKDKALAAGALAFFREKYPHRVSVYTIGDFSRELCGGPHVTSTGSIGSVRIDQDQSIGTGLRRIYARLA